MAEADVKVKVTADAEYDALEKMRAKLKELRREQRDLESSGWLKGSAREKRLEADKLERHIDSEGRRLLRVEDDDARRAAKAQRAEQSKVTQALKEEESARKAGIRGYRDRISDIAQTGRAAASGDISGALMGAGMRSGNPIAMVAGVVATVATGIASVLTTERNKDTMQGIQVRERRANDAFHLSRENGVFGSSAGLVSQSLEAEQEVAQRKAARVRLAEKARFKWNEMGTWTWGGLRKNAGQREEDENEAGIAAAERKAALARKAAQRKFSRGEGGLELDALRGRSERSLAGSRKAMVAEMGQAWLSKYKETIRQSNDPAMAKEMADLTVGNRLRDMQAQAGAGLVDARSGGAGIAAAAQWASGALPGMAEVSAQIANLSAIVQSGNREAALLQQAK